MLPKLPSLAQGLLEDGTFWSKMTQTQPKKLPRWPRMAPRRLQSNFWILALGPHWTGGVPVAGWLAGWNPKGQQVCLEKKTNQVHRLRTLIRSPTDWAGCRLAGSLGGPQEHTLPKKVLGCPRAPDHPKTFPELLP